MNFREFFSTITVLHQYDDLTYLIKTNLKCLKELNIINWEFNRPPDLTRKDEIKKYILHHNNILNIPFHLNVNLNEKEIFFKVLDGIHRYTSIKDLSEDEFNICKDKIIIIYIYLNRTKGELIDIFENLNKSICVPQIFINQEYTKDQKDIIQLSLEEWMEPYKSHFSPSISYRSPNINRDTLIEIITQIVDKYSLKSKDIIIKLLTKSNEYVKDYVLNSTLKKKKIMPVKFTENQLDKCKISGCYLFLYKDTIILEHIIPSIYDEIILKIDKDI